jgi:hypothetical protein
MIIKLILLLNIIMLSIKILTKNTNFYTLNCGLIGYCGATPPNLLKIALLIKYNEKRGEHATGILFNNKITKDLGSASLFLANYNDLFIDHTEKLLNNTIIAHTRQASVGSKDNINLAHPHEVENNSCILYGAHNGTISNIDDLADKYNIEHKSFLNSDSQTLFKILNRDNIEESFSVLSEYGGYASLLFTPAKFKNTLYVHKDKDRDLYIYEESINSIYISSIKESLYAIGGTNDTVKDIVDHTVFKYVKGKLVKTFKLPTKSTYYKPYVHKSNNKQNKSNTARFNDYYGERFPESLITTQNRLKNSSNCSVGKSYIGNGFKYHNSRYYKNGHLYNGEIYVTKDGTYYFYKPDVKDEAYTTFFILAGIMLDCEKNYNLLVKENSNSNNVLDTAKINKLDAFSFKKYLMYPILTSVNQEFNIGVLMFLPASYVITTNKETRSFRPLFSDLEITVDNNGLIITISEVNKKSLTVKEAIINVLSQKSEKINLYRNLYDLVCLEFEMSQNYSEVMSEFIDICADDNIITQETVEDLNLKGGSSNLGTKTLNESLNIITDLYIKYLNDLTIENSIDVFSKNTDLFFDTTVNTYYKNPNFIADITDGIPSTLYDLIIEWAPSNHEDDVYPILYATALVLKDLDYLSNEELITIKRNGLQRATTIVATCYNIAKACLKDKSHSENYCPVESKESVINYMFKNLKNYKINNTTFTERQMDNIKQTLKTIIKDNIEVLNYELLEKKYNIKKENLTELLTL